MTKRVVFAGGIQAKALARAYRLDIALDRDEDVYFIGTESMEREAAHRVIAAADILITDVSEAGESVPRALISENSNHISVPIVTADFLWPFAGAAHPRNAGSDALPAGPYPADFGDEFLDGLVAERMAEDAAVGTYTTLDVGKFADLDGLLRERLAAQARLDVLTGFDLADFIDQSFRSENLFATRERLRMPLFARITSTMLHRMGLNPLRANDLMEAPFPAGETPIHPGVLRHFGMTSPEPDHRYEMLDEGAFTFEQYCRRYMRYEWNEKLHAAILLSESNPALAIPALRLALETSPGSRAGLRALDDAERAVSDSRMLPPVALAAPAGYVPFTPTPPAPAAEEAPSEPYAEAEAEPLPELPEIYWKEPQASYAAAPIAEPEEEITHEDLFDPPADSTRDSSHSDATLPSMRYGFGGLRLAPQPGQTQLPLPPQRPAAEGADGRALVMFSAPAKPSTPPPDLDDEVPEQQTYVELPKVFGEPPEVMQTAAPGFSKRYVPLEPSKDLIEVLPRMLPNTRGLAGSVDRPFAAMPETMPPPPLRPILPPELHGEPAKQGLMSRLFGGSPK